VSHVVTVEVKVRSLEGVRRACRRLGWVFLEGQQTFKWYGQWVDDSPIPEGLFAADEIERLRALDPDLRREELTRRFGACDHAIRVPGCDYEIGLVRVADEYHLVYDFFWAGGLDKVLGTPDRPDAVNPFPQAYATEVAIMRAEENGFAWSETKLENGNVILEVETGW